MNIPSFVRSIVHSLSHSFIKINPFMHSFVYSTILSFIHSLSNYLLTRDIPVDAYACIHTYSMCGLWTHIIMLNIVVARAYSSMAQSSSFATVLLGAVFQ